jgi:CheY-like chemotaxis protein
MTIQRGQLSKIGCHVDVAANGLIAVNKFTRNKNGHVYGAKYDVILLDLEMPVKGNISFVIIYPTPIVSN